ncbi:hypothetical protein BS47DRAFT_1483970 [Hydnum rufescens UP504]|uniref:Uncharacterized protein n=1 Tax=Hydnum rufescens UP504 TaxID=1448309 RepID=A0A9P6B2R4_9AGAM|nr:hypothetical protein BS47DRAFT_1483970 [Hydnum rufescens UP504]
MATSPSSPAVLWQPFFLRAPLWSPSSCHLAGCSLTLFEVSRLDAIGISVVRGGSSDSMRTLVLVGILCILSPNIPSGWQLPRGCQPWGCWGKCCQTQIQWLNWKRPTVSLFGSSCSPQTCVGAPWPRWGSPMPVTVLVPLGPSSPWV